MCTHMSRCLLSNGYMNGSTFSLQIQVSLSPKIKQ